MRSTYLWMEKYMELMRRWRRRKIIKLWRRRKIKIEEGK